MGRCMPSGGWPNLLEEQKPLQVVWGDLKHLPSLITEAGKSFHGIRVLKQIHCDTYIFWFQFMPRWKWWEVEISWDQLLPGRSRDEHPGPGWAPGEGRVGTRGRSQFEAQRQIGLQWSQQSLALKVGKEFAGSSWMHDTKWAQRVTQVVQTV